MLPLVSYHARRTIPRLTLTLLRFNCQAVKAGAGIGAHVSFVDREGFGRKRLDTPPKELFHQVLSQAGSV
eukprot:485791-Rhodomonas_salina.4